MSIENADTADLIPLKQAIRDEIPGTPSFSTVWRWFIRGLAPAVDGEPRIKLVVLYVGNKPFTTRNAIREFIARTTQARIARMERRQQQANDVTDDDLASVGLRKPPK